MTTNFFLRSGAMSAEHLSWIEECLKFFFLQLYPETLGHRAGADTPLFTFLLTGDALYSLEDPETIENWSVILSFSAVRMICDREELDLRGIAIDRMKMKYPDQVVDTNAISKDNRPSFWADVIALVRANRPSYPDSLGWLQITSPYMHRSALYGIRCLSAGLETYLSPELYAYLDGIHMGHAGQAPTEAENIGLELESLNDRAERQGLSCQYIACNRCATARGYSRWDDHQDADILTNTIKPFRLKDMDVMTERFMHPHIILADNAASVQFPKRGTSATFDRAEKSSTSPPVTILVTSRPYTTETAYGAIAFAVASAYRGILTRVVFIEDGIYCVSGTCKPPSTEIFSIPDIINAVAGSENLHFFALMASFQKRGVAKNKDLNAVLDIGFPGLGKILFYPPGNVNADHQRVLIF